MADLSTCQHCAQPFTRADSRQVYCTGTCRNRANHRRARQAKREQAQQKLIEEHRQAVAHWSPDPLPAPMPWPPHEVPVMVVAHPQRLEQARHLAQETTAEAIAVDDGPFGCEVNHLRAWEWLGSGRSPWSVVLEDDAVPVPRFRYQLHAALKVAPTPIVSLYLGRTRPPHWQSSIAAAVGHTRLQDACFLTAPALLHGVGYAIRTSLIPDLLARVPKLARSLPIDEAITVWARLAGHRISYTWPSLVDHHDGPSLINHRDGQPRRSGRVAWCADWREQWTPTTHEIAEPTHFRHEEAG